MVKRAIFNEDNVPKGGTCLSAFLILRNKEGVLAGKMTKPEIWVDKFLVGEMFAPKYAASGKWILPASHLLYGEKPEDGATRVLAQQLGLPKTELKLVQAQSHLSQSPTDPDAAHWDICFIYEGQVPNEIRKPEWFSELKFLQPQGLKADDFTRGHGDVLLERGMIKN
jgi:ADP-ribose pyrophosphatase YjhB (NUDIX family)